MAEFGMLVRCCPKAGQRAAELVAGRVEELLESLMNSAMTRLLVKVQVRLSAAQWASMMDDFARVRSFLVVGLQIKYDFRKHFP